MAVYSTTWIGNTISRDLHHVSLESKASGAHLYLTLEALVVSWGERAAQHHHSGINNNLPTATRRSRDLSPSSPAIQTQGQLIVMPI